LLIVAALVVVPVGQGLAQAPPAQAAAASQPADPASQDSQQKFVVPVGTKILLSLKSAVNTRTAQPGDGVYLVSNFPVVISGHVLIPDGVYVQGVVDRVVRPGKVKGRAQISMHFTTFIFPNGQVIPIPGTLNSLPGSTGAKVGSEGNIQQPGSKGKDAATVVKGTELGGEVGTIGGVAAGNWGAGLGYGALGGAAAGAISTLFTRGEDINIPVGSPVEMVIQRPLELVPQQYATVDPEHNRQQYAPVGQQPPLKKPGSQLPCSADGVGCN
jgi:type IV secretion system protein VirB10